MNKLKSAVEAQGRIISDEVLKVDSFLNHQVDCSLVMEMAEQFYEHFKDKNVTKVVTIESSGIAPSFATACKFNVPMIFIKKAQPSTMQNPVSHEVFSFTKNKHYTICMEKDYLTANDNVLFIDDFLANGEAFKAAEVLIKECGANISGVGIVIEKAFQKGHQYILDNGYDLCALASIASIKDKKITWAE